MKANFSSNAFETFHSENILLSFHPIIKTLMNKILLKVFFSNI